MLMLRSPVAVVLQEKAQAQGFANALATIGKFALKKKAGDKDQLFARWVDVWWIGQIINSAAVKEGNGSTFMPTCYLGFRSSTSLRNRGHWQGRGVTTAVVIAS